jgi:hypothetical protein
MTFDSDQFLIYYEVSAVILTVVLILITFWSGAVYSPYLRVEIFRM